MKNVVTVHRKGSALLLVIMLMSALLMYLTIIWRTTSYTYDITLSRKKYEERYWLTYALMMWAVQLCKENFDTMQAHVDYASKTISIKHWPPSSKKSSHATVIIAKINDNQLALKAKVESMHTYFYCILKRMKEDVQSATFILEEWDDNHS